MRTSQQPDYASRAWFEFSAKTEKRIKGCGAAVGLSILMFTLGGAMEGRGLDAQYLGIVSDAQSSEMQSPRIAARPTVGQIK
ncbi:hypothetical protein A8B78_09240 [Jannaschia sp. EhC01]|nr:hypothetical protein A8B78_09240 [Jannaschia sp. EhC01]